MSERLTLRNTLVPGLAVSAGILAPTTALAGQAEPVPSDRGGVIMTTSNGFVVGNDSIKSCQMAYPARPNTELNPNITRNYINDADVKAKGSKIIGALSVHDVQLSGGSPVGVHRQDFDCDEVISVSTTARIFNIKTGKTVTEKQLNLDDNGTLNRKPKKEERKSFSVQLPKKASSYGKLGVKMIVKTTPNFDAPYTYAPFKASDTPNAPHSKPTSGSYKAVVIKK